MSPVRIHREATAVTLAGARILVGLIWLVRLIGDPISRLGYLPAELWYPQGIMLLLPRSLIEWFAHPTRLTVLRLLAILGAVLLIVGLRGRRFHLGALVLLLVVYFGIAKGFGGHVNHREMVLLYVTALMVFLPCFDALTLSRPESTSRPQDVYSASMVAVCLVIALNYMFIGLARLSIGAPSVFDPDLIRAWLLDRSVRPNPIGFEFGRHLLEFGWSGLLLPLFLPVSTVVEIAAPAMLWAGRVLRLLLVGALISLHIAIFFLMNIVFIENVLLLLLFTEYGPWLDGWLDSVRGRRPSMGVPTSTPESVA